MRRATYTLEEKLGAVLEYRRSWRLRATGRRLGVSHENVRRWNRLYEAGALYNAGADVARAGKEAGMPEVPRGADELPDDPAELKRIVLEQRLEIDLMRAVTEVVKKDPGVDLSTLSSREKTMVIDAMRPTYSLSCLAARLAIPASTYHYNHAAIATGDRYGALRGEIRAICEGHGLTWGYRRVKLELQHGPRGEVRSEKVVVRLMREMGLQARRPRAAGYSSHSAGADVSELPNLPLRGDGTHDFSAAAPNALWLTDVTQFRIPAGRVCLSPVLDAFDGALPGWQISVSAASDRLTDPSLEKACESLGEGDSPTCHSDRGAC